MCGGCVFLVLGVVKLMVGVVCLVVGGVSLVVGMILLVVGVVSLVCVCGSVCVCVLVQFFADYDAGQGNRGEGCPQGQRSYLCTSRPSKTES